MAGGAQHGELVADRIDDGGVDHTQLVGERRRADLGNDSHCQTSS